MKQIIIASYSFIAAVIGAGFASGQEIMCYFVRFGKLGFPGIVIFAAVFAVFSFSVMCACKKLGILTENEKTSIKLAEIVIHWEQ